MSQLQKLLDEKWPKLPDDSRAGHELKNTFRLTFTEGYNAAIQEIREGAQKTVDLVNNRNKPQTNG